MSGTEVARRRTTMDWLGEQSGVQIAHGDHGELLVSLDADLEKKVNVLAPISQIAQVDRNFSPTVKTVRLTPGVDSYKQGYSKNKGGELHALTKQGLMKLADLAGIEFLAPQIDYMGGVGVSVTATGRRRGPDGLWRAHRATKAVWFDRLEKKIRREAIANAKKYGDAAPGEEDLDKRVDDEMEHIVSKIETKAMNRVIRSFLSVKNVYTLAELAKPFFIVGVAFTPDAKDPNVQALIAANYGMASAEVYPEPRAALGPGGSPVDVTDMDADEDVTDEEDATEEADVPDVDPQTGEVIDAELADEEPGWDAPEGEQEWDGGIPMPEDAITFTAGPYGGKTAEEVVKSEEGCKWLATTALKLRGLKRMQAVAWLEWAYQESFPQEEMEERLTQIAG